MSVKFLDAELSIESVDRLIDFVDSAVAVTLIDRKMGEERRSLLTVLYEARRSARDRTASDCEPMIRQLARADAKLIAQLIKAHAEALERIGEKPESSVVLDGSAYSPSWRCLPGGAAAYKMAEDMPSLAEMYDDAILEYVEMFASEVVGWEEGCLWVNWSPDIPDEEERERLVEDALDRVGDPMGDGDEPIIPRGQGRYADER